MTPQQRKHFDRLLEQVLADLPQHVRKWLDEVPLIVEDYPSDEVMDEFGLEYLDELCGLHDGIPLTDRSVGDHRDSPDQIMIYREGIYSSATDEKGNIPEAELLRQIRITVLHEIGHHFGLDEDDLTRLGYD